MLEASRFTRLAAPWFAAAVLLSWAALLGPEPVWAQATDVKCDKCVDTKDIAKKAVKASRLARGAVKTNKLRDGAVTLNKLGSDVTALGLSGVAVLPAAAFQPIDIPTNAGFNDFWWQAINLNTEVCLLAAVYLPDGVTISQFQAIVIDNATTQNIEVDLERITPAAIVLFGPSDNFFHTVATVATDVAGAQLEAQLVSSMAISEPLVDAVENNYQVRTCFMSDNVNTFNTVILGARVFYE